MGLSLAPTAIKAIGSEGSPGSLTDLGLAGAGALLRSYGGETGADLSKGLAVGAPVIKAGVDAGIATAQGLAPGAAFASSLASGAAALPFMMFMGGGPLKAILPDTEPTERLRRRAGRNRDAQSLQAQILRPIVGARTPADLDAAFAQKVGGASIGDALASMVGFNLSGDWYGGAAGHQWLPDLALVPLQRYLREHGYRGTQVEQGEIVRREPSQGDVGGVGEIMAGAGGLLLTPEDVARYQGDPIQTDNGPDYSSTHLQKLQGGAGALGWNNVLRRLTGIVTGQPITAPSVFDLTVGDTDRRILDAEGSAAGLRDTPTAWESYLTDLDAFDPGAGRLVREGAARRQDMEDARREAMSAGGDSE